MRSIRLNVHVVQVLLTVGAVFSVMKAEYVVVAEQAHPLGPAYSFPYCREGLRMLLLLDAIILFNLCMWKCIITY